MGNYLIVTLVGVGIFFTISTGFIQIKGFPLAVNELVNSIKGKNKVKGRELYQLFRLYAQLSAVVWEMEIL